MLRFFTCGSVDDGKSTLIGRLLYDSKSIFEDIEVPVWLWNESPAGTFSLGLEYDEVFIVGAHLTGSIFANNEEDVQRAFDALRFAAGNFYINDKPTGAVVAQQPFGGARASGTNDKAGGPLNLLRWISPRSVKRTLDIPQDWGYPFMQPE